MFCQNHSLQPWNSFHLDVYAEKISVINSAALLCKAWQDSHRQQQPTLLLGEGSNVLFLEDFTGHVLINRIKGIRVSETEKAWLLHVGAGENWHQLVEFCLQRGMAGIENLALIPGCVGSAPIQNIGAYGVEFRQLCDYVDVVHLPTGHYRHFTVDECQFGYRDSQFKHASCDEYAIIAVGLKLNKIWHPVLTYGDLTRLDPVTVTPKQIFDAVCHMRRSKLPDPAVTGNAGSFFKNPIVEATKAQDLLQHYPAMPRYAQSDGTMKLAAGWLIDQCELKGYQLEGAMVHRQQALVLINQSDAKGHSIVALARKIRECVGERFDIWLEPEVRFIGPQGEIDAIKAIS
ncbi:UDP-N-acetylmuramate dehydrogenase [Enterobacteriaceae bacterium LUAb1]